MSSKSEKLSVYVSELVRLSLEMVALKRNVAKLLPTGTHISFVVSTGTKHKQNELVRHGVVCATPLITIAADGSKELLIGIPVTPERGQAMSHLVQLGSIKEIFKRERDNA